MLCKLCEKINVADLVDLAQTNSQNLKIEGPNGTPKTEFLEWRHCQGYEDLVVAAQAGCELCQLLREALDQEIRNPQEGLMTYKDALLKMEKDGTSTGFSITIDSEGEQFNGSMSPRIIPRDREAYVKDMSAAFESRRHALGNASASATLNAATRAPSAESESSKSVPAKTDLSTQYIKSYRDMILNCLTFHIGIENDAPLIFSLQVPRGQAKFVGPLQIGHFALDPDLRSEANFSIARSWIKTCSEEHDICPAMEDKPLPTRVINVGSDDREPFLVLTNNKKANL